MNNLTTWNYNNSEVRTVTINNEPWWVLKDVCNILEIKNHKEIPNRLEADEVGRFDLPHPQNNEKALEMVCINESGLYSVILRSDKPQAKPFRKWVTSEVLPSIRRHGAYMTAEAIERTLSDPDFIIQLATTLKTEQEKNKQLEVKVSALTIDNQIMQPKADYFDELVDRNLLTGIRETAKELKIKQKVFVNFLLDRKYLYRDKHGKLMPYAKHIENGLFELKEFANEKTGFSSTQVFITPKGKETFRLLLIA